MFKYVACVKGVYLLTGEVPMDITTYLKIYLPK